MKVRVLGAHNLEVEHVRHTCFLLDGVLALDAGSLMTALSEEERKNIRAILVTHRHFDHVRDLPSLGLANLDESRTVSVYSLPVTLDAVSSRLMDGVLYPDFTQSLTPAGPKYRLEPITSGQTFAVQGYSVRAIEVPHAAPCVGYVIHQPEGSSFAYCGDTGGGLLPFFQDPSRPDPMFVEVTFAGKLEERAKITGHLTPGLLRKEIEEAASQGLTIPCIMVVHRNPDHEQEIAEELASVASELGVDISLAHEGVTVDI